MKLPFDKVYCLHLVEDTNRYENIKKQFKKLNIEDQVNIWWTCKRPISNFIGDKLTTLHSRGYDDVISQYNFKTLYGGAFNCAYEFYTIIKTTYLQGYETILVMEDDIIFYDDFDYEHFFSNLPNDWDILRLGYSKQHEEYIKKHNTSGNFLFKADVQFAGMCLTAFNRKAMKFYIDFMDDKFKYSDAPISECFDKHCEKYLSSKLNVYTTETSIVNVNSFSTTIK